MKGDIFGIPAEAVSGIPAVRLLGNELTEIINHKGLRRCTEEEICILTKIGDISVKGSELVIKEINSDGIRIEGKVNCICYV